MNGGGLLKLRITSFLWGLALAFVIFTGHILFSNFVIMDGFTEIERRHSFEKLHSARSAINNQLKQLDLFVWDWSSWDDTYFFAQNLNAEYIHSNLAPSTFTDQNLTAIILRNAAGDTIFAKSVDEEGQDAPEIRKELLSLTSNALPSLGGKSQGKGGLVIIHDKFYIIACRPILLSSGEGPAHGAIYMVKTLSEEVLNTLSLGLGYQIELLLPKDAADLMQSILHEERNEIILNRGETAAVVAALLNTIDQAGAVLRITVNRDITLFGQRVAQYNTIIIALAALLFGALTYFLVNKKILSRLERLDKQLSTVNQSPRETRLHADGNDEITDLATNINLLLTEIDCAHQEQLAQAEEIAGNEHFLNQVLNSISVGILLVDPESREIVSINDHLLTLAQREREEVVGRICHRLTCPAEIDNCPILDKGQPKDLSKRKLLTRDGGEIPIMKSVSFVNKGGRSLLLETIIDITEIERSHNELEKLKNSLEITVAERTSELEEANRELIALDRAKSLFLSSASHELRTPLTSILGFIKLMEKKFTKSFFPILNAHEDAAQNADTFMANLTVVRTEAERLGRLVNDLLDLNKIESGRMEWRDEKLNVNDLLAHTAEAFSGQRTWHNDVELLVEPSEEETFITVDKDRIQQVLINLLSNAFKFTEKGHVRLAVQSEGDFVSFSVTDTGRGIPPENHDHIFEIFYQVEDENQRSSKEFGTGLGLAICRQIVSHYGGTIGVESTRGEGSCFSFTVPKARA